MTKQIKSQTLEELTDEVRKNKYFKKAYRKLGEPDCYEFGLFIEAFIKKVYEAGGEAVLSAIDTHAERVIQQIEKQSPIISDDSPVNVTSKMLQISKVQQGLDQVKKSIKNILLEGGQNDTK